VIKLYISIARGLLESINSLVPFYNFSKTLILIPKGIILRYLVEFSFTLNNSILYITLLYPIFLRIKLLELSYRLTRLVLKKLR
jgi:hypothetical protein